jgi:NACHT domain
VIFLGCRRPADNSRLLKLLPYAAQAAFNSADKQHDPLCLQDTRVDVLNQIRAWADVGDERCIFWLNGMAGTGKSTIARTIAQEYYDRNRLGASFFFSRSVEDRSHAGMFFTTIAVQLAHILSALKQHICTAVDEHNDITKRRQRDQWEHLILQPLSKLMANSCQSPLILVIDALDECDGDNDIKGILQLFAQAKSLGPIQLRIFITSRPEIPIRLGFRDMPGILHRDLVLNNVPREIIDDDISIYFRHELRDIELSARVITRLTEKACGLFIWAATACRFIKNGKLVASERLSLILEGGKSERNPEKELDQIYAKILSDSVGGDYDEDEEKAVFELFRKIIGAIVILFNPLSAAALSELLTEPRSKVSQILSNLHSVLEAPENNVYPIRLLHPSLRDFLLAKERCQQLWVDEKQIHLDLTKNCLRLMSNRLKRDICGLHNPGAFMTDVGSDRVEQFLPPEVQYACIYWVQHLQKSGAQLGDDDQVHQFLREHLLHWLEAFSLMGKMSEGVLAITSLESVIPVSYITVY